MYTRVLPGTLAPRYHELQLGCVLKRPFTTEALCSIHSSCASGAASMVLSPWSRRWRNASVIQSTWSSIEATMFVSTDGLPGPVTVKRFGKPATWIPR